MHTAERAIILAAGRGERLRPVTLTTPKPLVKVNGIRMIDTIVSALHHHGIHEIYVVIGHLKECFYELAKEHPEITLIENPYYDHCNNIASLYVARDHLKNAIICEGDLFIRDPEIIFPQFNRSGYDSIWTDGDTKEWLFHLENDRIAAVNMKGGHGGWQQFGISRWTPEDAEKLRAHLELEFETNQEKSIFWDEIPVRKHVDEYNLEIRSISADTQVEIDSYEELCQIDPSYR